MLMARAMDMIRDAVDGTIIFSQGIETKKGECYARDCMDQKERSQAGLFIALNEGDDLHGGSPMSFATHQ